MLWTEVGVKFDFSAFGADSCFQLAYVRYVVTDAEKAAFFARRNADRDIYPFAEIDLKRVFAAQRAVFFRFIILYYPVAAFELIFLYKRKTQ